MYKQSIQSITTAIAAIVTITSMASAQAVPLTGSGTASSPYQIATAADLAMLASLVNAASTNADFADKHYRLTADIDLSGHANWAPIGVGLIRAEGRDDRRLTFRGVFDGGGKRVVNLKITGADRLADSFQGSGLFGVVDGGTVRGLGLEGVSVSVNAGVVGGVAGAAVAGSVITDCYVVGGVSGIGSVGGIAGHVDDGGAVSSSYVVGDVSGADRVGGIAGYVYNSSITSCYATGNISEGGAVAGHVWNSAVVGSEVFDPEADAEKILAALPERLLTHVVTDAKNAPPIIAVVSEPPGGVSGGIAAGPNPVSWQSGAVNFFRQGKKIKRGTLTISNSMGKVVNKINLLDNSASSDCRGWRQVGSWDLKDRRGRVVSDGSYIAKGMVVGSDGKRERVSIVLGVR